MPQFGPFKAGRGAGAGGGGGPSKQIFVAAARGAQSSSSSNRYRNNMFLHMYQYDWSTVDDGDLAISTDVGDEAVWPAYSENDVWWIRAPDFASGFAGAFRPADLFALTATDIAVEASRYRYTADDESPDGSRLGVGVLFGFSTYNIILGRGSNREALGNLVYSAGGRGAVRNLVRFELWA